MQTLLVLLVLATFAAALYVLIFKVEWNHPRAEIRGKLKGLNELVDWMAKEGLDPDIKDLLLGFIKDRRIQLEKELEGIQIESLSNPEWPKQ